MSTPSESTPTVITSNSSSNSTKREGGTEIALSELNETVSRLSSHHGVELVQILNRNGDIIAESGTPALLAVSVPVSVSSSSLSPEQQQQQQIQVDENKTNITVGDEDEQNQQKLTASTAVSAGASNKVSTKARMTKELMRVARSYIQSLEPDDDITFIQIRSQKGYELLIAPHEGYVLAVLKRE